MLQWFAEGGWWMWPLAALAVAIFVGSGLGLVAMQVLQWDVQARRMVALLPLSLGVLAVGIAVVGYTSSMRVVSDAVAAVGDAETRDRLLMQGKAECLHIVYLGAGVAILSLFETMMLSIVAQTKNNKTRESTPL